MLLLHALAELRLGCFFVDEQGTGISELLDTFLERSRRLLVLAILSTGLGLVLRPAELPTHVGREAVRRASVGCHVLHVARAAGEQDYEHQRQDLVVHNA